MVGIKGNLKRPKKIETAKKGVLGGFQGFLGVLGVYPLKGPKKA